MKQKTRNILSLLKKELSDHPQKYEFRQSLTGPWLSLCVFFFENETIILQLPTLTRQLVISLSSKQCQDPKMSKIEKSM